MEERSGVLETSRSCKQLIGPEGSDKEFEGYIDSNLRVVETFLRLFPIGLCVTALVIMLKNSQENKYGSVSYTDLGAFRYVSQSSHHTDLYTFFLSFSFLLYKN